LNGIGGMIGSIRLRYFGPRPLTADDAVRSKVTTLVNIDGYRINPNVSVVLDVFKVLNAQDPTSTTTIRHASRLNQRLAA
jgi:hypothetical protein